MKVATFRYYEFFFFFFVSTNFSNVGSDMQGFLEFFVYGAIQHLTGQVPEQSDSSWPCWTRSPPEVLCSKLFYNSMSFI